jgi:DNA-binding PadR family transcriptional regulator
MSLRFGLLGLIKYSPMTGYDLKRIFEQSINFFWSAETSQIYRELKGLEKSGLIESRIEFNTTRPNRRVYTITDIGIAALKNWLHEFSGETKEDNRNEFLMRVFLSSNIGGDELLLHLETRLEKYRRDLTTLQGLGLVMESYRDKFDVEGELLYWNISVRRGFHDVQSHIAWAEESIQYLRELGFK